MTEGPWNDFKPQAAAGPWDDFKKPDAAQDYDVVKSLGTGLAKGGIGIAGTAGDARNLASAATDYIGKKIGASPEAVQGFKDKAASVADYLPGGVGTILANAPSSGEIQKGVEGVTGEFHKPQTVPGQYAQTLGEFAPGALGGGEGLLARALTRVALPAAASETAGQITKDTAAEPYARIAAGVGAGGLASTLARAERVAAPTAEELKDAARTGYNSPEVRAVRFAAQPTEDLANRASIALRGEGFRPNLDASGKPVFQLVDELRGASNVADIDGVRKALSNLAKERNTVGQLTPNAVAANRAIDHINDFLPNLRPADVLAGDARRASGILHEAGQNWGAASRAEEVATRAENARIQAGSTYGGGNINNALRQALRPLAKNNFQKARGFNQEEQDALERAVTGSWAGNTARQVGKLGPDTGLKGIEHVIAAANTGGASIPLSMAALGAKLGGDASTRRAIGRLDTMLRERSPLHAENVAQAAQPMIPNPAAPGAMIPNPNYIAPLAAGQGRGQSALINAMLASTAPRLNVYPSQPAQGGASPDR